MSTTKNGFYNTMNGARLCRPRRKAANLTNQPYVDPWDNLLYAILIQAAMDSRGAKMDGARYEDGRPAEAVAFLKSDTAAAWWRYLGRRPKHNN